MIEFVHIHKKKAFFKKLSKKVQLFAKKCVLYSEGRKNARMVDSSFIASKLIKSPSLRGGLCFFVEKTGVS